MTTLRSRIARGLTRTREILLTDVTELFGPGARPDSDTLDALEDRLLEADLGPAAATRIRDRLEDKLRGQGSCSPDEITTFMSGILTEILTPHARPRDFTAGLAASPHVVLFVGVNGSGKTTTIGKMAHAWRETGRSVLIAAADTYRAAAVEQLEVWAGRTGADFVRSHEGADPAAVAWDALEAAIARGSDVLLIDTAGRLHTRHGLMEELAKISRVLDKRLEGAPHEILLVLDATTGQNAIVQAREFTDRIGVTGLILTKLDGTARGGVTVAVAEQVGIGIEMVGVGEELEALQPFDAAVFAAALLAPESG